MNRTQDVYASLLASHTRQTKSKVLEDMRKTLYLSADEAIEYGIIDHVLPTKKSQTKRATKKASSKKRPKRKKPAAKAKQDEQTKEK
jgi:hypothetical protein